MKLLTVLMLLFITVMLTAADGCDFGGVVGNAPAYIEAGQDVTEVVTNVDTSGDGLSDAKEYVLAGKNIAIAASKIPGAQAWAGTAVGVLTAVSMVLSIFGVKKTKEASDNKKEGDGHKRLSEDYRDAITAGLAHGSDPTTVDKGALVRVLDTATKTHLNQTGDDRV